jgi:hypothetical protein
VLASYKVIIITAESVKKSPPQSSMEQFVRKRTKPLRLDAVVKKARSELEDKEGRNERRIVPYRKSRKACLALSEMEELESLVNRGSVALKAKERELLAAEDLVSQKKSELELAAAAQLKYEHDLAEKRKELIQENADRNTGKQIRLIFEKLSEKFECLDDMIGIIEPAVIQFLKKDLSTGADEAGGSNNTSAEDEEVEAETAATTHASPSRGAASAFIKNSESESESESGSESESKSESKSESESESEDEKSAGDTATSSEFLRTTRLTDNVGGTEWNFDEIHSNGPTLSAINNEMQETEEKISESLSS